MKSTDTIRSTCGFCHVGCGVLVHMEDGRVKGVEGDGAHPLNRGELCPKGHASVEYLYHPDRLRRPLKRAGERGRRQLGPHGLGRGDRARLPGARPLAGSYGAKSVAIMRGSAKGLQDDYLARFANVFGSPNFLSMGQLCWVPRKNASLLTYGFYAIPDLDHPPRTIIVWGENVSETLHYNFSRIMEAQKAGTTLVVVDPHKSRVAGAADMWVRLKPGSDLPLALAMLNTIMEESLYDRAFVESETTGFEELRRHVAAYTPERVAPLTSLTPRRSGR